MIILISLLVLLCFTRLDTQVELLCSHRVLTVTVGRRNAGDCWRGYEDI
jgi:hypothetical protein